MDRARRLAWSLSGAATLVWVAAVALAGAWGRVADNWASALTMLFGSFLAGSSPEGGSAVAFPVFTKALHVPGEVARTFGLSIQAVGMTMAVIAILLYRRPLERTALTLAIPSAVVGFLFGLLAFAETDVVFWPARFSAGWVKATFSIVLATTSVLMVRRLRSEEEDTSAAPWCTELRVIVGITAFVGGALSSLTGTGANILVFLVLVVVAGVDPKRALPTAIVVMAAVSVVGTLLLGVFDGQLDVELVGDRVVGVGSTGGLDLEASRADLLGLWLAAVPVVVWGAPLGSWAAARVRERWLVSFVAVLAAVEVLTTLVLVDDLRSNPAMISYMLAGLILLPTCLLVLARRKRSWLVDDAS
jgi:uncharacterized protein